MKCKCGCGKDITPKSWHKYYRHDFLPGHRVSKKLKKTTCAFCKKTIYKRFPKCLSHLKNTFCSKKCCGLFKKQTNIKTCSICGRLFSHKRGLRYKNTKSKKLFCSSACFHKFNIGSNNPNWKGGIEITTKGYKSLVIANNKYVDNRNRVLEHRLVMQNHLKRKLSKNEIIHHIDGNMLNNSIENLEILSRSEHARLHRNLHQSKDISVKVGP